MRAYAIPGTEKTVQFELPNGFDYSDLKKFTHHLVTLTVDFDPDVGGGDVGNAPHQALELT